ncbi:MAG: hypothetical protein JSV04_06760 [Candidatus Heimdallarchaeota archaeon]|nr:MAG: hypothetical protein JSV04_06760 [Candidatus Heimdallarchaeota archaeon]
MATRDEKQFRIELPSTSGVECEIRGIRGEFVLTFYQNERMIKTSTVSSHKLNQDQMVDLLSDAGVEFFSFSAIFEVADLLVNSIKKEFMDVVEEGIEVVEEPEEVQVTETITTVEETPTDISVSTEQEIVTLEPGDKLLKKIEMPYSQGGFAGVYYCRDGKYAIILFQNENPIVRKKFVKEKVNDEALVGMISESGIDFLSFSAIYDSAEQLQKIIMHPEEYIEAEEPEEILTAEADEVRPEVPPVSISEVEEVEDEIVMVDISGLDVSEYTKAEDFDNFVGKVTELVNKGQPLPVKEIPIEKSGGVICIVLRQIDSWFVRFKQEDGSLSDVTEVKIDQDELAKVINQDIPQISFSYLYDASEKVFHIMKQLTKRPMNDVILNVAVGHFLQVIEQHETDGDLKAAAKVTEVLLERFRHEKNVRGINQFGKKLLDYFEQQKKATQAAKLRNSLAEELLEIEPSSALDFIMDSLDLLVTQEKFLNAANLCGLLLDHYLSEEENIAALKHVLMLGRIQIEYYKQARLPVVMWENALRYAHYAIRQLAKLDDEQVEKEQRDIFQEDINYLLDQAFEVQEERKAHFELLESLEITLKLFKETDDKINYLKYSDKLIISLETQDKKEKALEVTMDGTNFLMDSENFVKACDYGNRSIKLFYELNKISEAVDFSLDVVRGLIDLKEAKAAQDYLKFVESLIDKAFKTEEKQRVEKHLIIGDLYGKLGLKDQAKSYIQSALQTIGDAKKREKIVLNYVDDLLQSHAVLSAQEMVNLELSRLLNEKEVDEAIHFCQNFIQELVEHKQQDMVFQYMKYCSDLMIQTEHIDYKILSSFIQDLIKVNDNDRAAIIMNQLITLQYKKGDYTRAIDSIGRFIDHLIEQTDRIDLVEYYIQRSADTYREMGDPDGSIGQLINFQKQILDFSVVLAQKITDLILKELEQKEDFKKAINIVSPLIEKQIDHEKYQDAYIFCVQNARYYERLGDISKVIQYLESMRDRFLEKDQSEDANRMTDLILRFCTSHKKHKLAITAMKNYSKSALDRGDTETATRFAIEMAKLLEEQNQGDKALEFLQMIFNTTYEEDRESALTVFKRIVEIRAAKDEFKKVSKKYLQPLISQYRDIQLIEISREALQPSFEDYFSFAELLSDDMVESDEISDEIADFIADFVNSTYDEGQVGEGDRIAKKYTDKLLIKEKIASASRIMATILEKTQEPISEVLPLSFKFIKELISASILEGAREFTDQIINMVTTEKKFGSEGRLLAAKITEKFAIYVSSENPDLASEYAYQASNFYRSLNDFNGVVNVYSNLANQTSSPKRAIVILKRGINLCKKFKADKYEAQLLSHLTEFLIKTNNPTALTSLQQTLEKYEELQDLDELFNVVQYLIEIAIETDNLKIAYTYLDYITRLSTMIDKTEGIGGIISFLLHLAEKVRDTENVELVQKYINELGIKPKKFKKEHKALAEKRAEYLESKLGVVEIIEPEAEVEAVPELVETEAVVTPVPEAPPFKVSQEMIDETIDEEFVSAIKEFKQEKPVPSPEEGITPTTEESPALDTIAPSTTEFLDEEEPEEKLPEMEPIRELPKEEIPDFQAPKQKAALTDDEITSLFSMGPSSQEVSPDDDKITLDSFTKPVEAFPAKGKLPKMKESALSEEEVDLLFRPGIKDDLEESQVEDTVSDEEEWEVDGFGRLWRKGTLPTTEIDQPTSEVEEQPGDIDVGTPDLSPLEKLIQQQEEEEVQDISPPDTQIESELRTDLFDKEIQPYSSIVKSLTEDEEAKSIDIFEVPEVEYKEIPSEESKESQIQVPDLSDLFSDALSELGTISGEVGDMEKDKKKKKK